MKTPFVFGTDAELQAAASLLQIPVYVLNKPMETGGWEWMHYKPHDKISREGIMRLPDTPPTFRIEILYVRAGAHFDLIVPQNRDIPLPLPQLPDVPPTLHMEVD